MTNDRNIPRLHSVFLVPALIFIVAGSAIAVPLRLTVHPKGTNQVQVTLTPLVTNQFYEVLVRTNAPDGHWIRFAGLISDTNTSITAVCDLGQIAGLTLGTIKNWRFVAGRWDDPLGDELPLLYKELVLRIDPYASADPYADPMGDGWSNLQKLQNDMDPFGCSPPPPPQLSVSIRGTGTNGHSGSAYLTWDTRGGPVPEFFVVERAIRKPHFRTNDTFMRPMPYGPYRGVPPNGKPNSLFSPSSNSPPNWPANSPFRGRTATLSICK
jgi:hypothetical protein